MFDVEIFSSMKRRRVVKRYREAIDSVNKVFENVKGIDLLMAEEALETSLLNLKIRKKLMGLDRTVNAMVDAGGRITKGRYSVNDLTKLLCSMSMSVVCDTEWCNKGYPTVCSKIQGEWIFHEKSYNFSLNISETSGKLDGRAKVEGLNFVSYD